MELTELQQCEKAFSTLVAAAECRVSGTTASMVGCSCGGCMGCALRLLGQRLLGEAYVRHSPAKVV